MEKNKIYNTDCVFGMQQMINENLTVDFILTDPPYNISRDSNFTTMNRRGIDFGQWDVNFCNDPWLKKSFSVLKPGGSLIVFNSVQQVGTIIDTATKYGYIFKDCLIWHKTNPMPRNVNRRYVQNTELALLFVKPGEKWKFHNLSGKYEGKIFDFASETCRNKRFHPTQKPVKLIKKLLEIHSDEYDLVLDPFMGSGTTAVACQETNRNFIGFELDKNYFEKASKRIDQCKCNDKESKDL